MTRSLMIADAAAGSDIARSSIITKAEGAEAGEIADLRAQAAAHKRDLRARRK